MEGVEASLQTEWPGLSRRVERKLLLQWGWGQGPALPWVCREKGGSESGRWDSACVWGGRQQTLEQ